MKETKKENKKVTTVVNFILDKSGSMNSVKDSTIEGFNEYLLGLQKSDKDVRLSLTLFDTESIETPYIDKPIAEVEPLTSKTYIPMGGTPLYDAVVETLEKVYAKPTKKSANIVVIMTDGEENSSTKHTEKCLTDIKEKLEKLGNWTFVFMGANQDAWETAGKLGFTAGNVMSWESTAKGTQTAYRNLAMSTANYSADVSRGVTSTNSFFVEKEKEKNDIT